MIKDTKRQVCLLALITLAVAACARVEDSPEGGVGVVNDPCASRIGPPQSMIDANAASLKPGYTGSPPVVSAADQRRFDDYQANLAKRDWANLCQYQDDDATLADRPATDRLVVFIGDSTTQNWQLSDPELFTHGIVNRGVGMQTTPQMLLRFESDVIALHPKVVQIMAGVNDIAGNTGPTTLTRIENNVTAMVTLARANHIRVVLASVLPTNHLGWAPTVDPVGPIRDLNAWLKAYASHEGLTYVDFFSVLAAPDGGMKSELTVDGVHPNAAGYAAIRPLVDATLKQEIRKPPDP